MVRPSRSGLVHVALIAFAATLVGRAAFVELWQGRVWAARAARQHMAPAPVAASRGPILDAAGTPLIVSRDVVELSVAPREVRDRPALARALLRAGVPAGWVQRATDPTRAWVPIPTRLMPGPAASASAIRGVYSDQTPERVGLGASGLSAVLGHVGANGRGLDGLEAALDTLLRGDGRAGSVMHDALGRVIESPAAPEASGHAGDVVVLTINRSLQEICARALDEAVDRMGATGGDIVVLDPHDGSILALASRRAGVGDAAATTLTEPFEPGSTLKPFIAAALLSRHRVQPTDVVDTRAGRIEINGRILTDTHRAPEMTLRDVVRWSSNVGIAQFVQRLSTPEEFQALRDAGFGSPTGLPFPGEASGTLRDPARWSKQSPVSLAIGYELAVTPIQLALAYGAIANGGELLEPALVREIRTADGAVVYRGARRVVRRIMSPEIAAQLRDILIETVARGTASEASMPSFAVAGKTGTARRVQYGAGYGRNEYTASFVGLFPGRDPQYVILVKMDNPKGSYFGGKTAAPVSRSILEAAVAARDAALDRGALASDRLVALVDTAVDRPAVTGPIDSDAAGTGGAGGAGGDATVTLAALAGGPGRHVAAAGHGHGGREVVTVPDVRGLPLRAAVRALHRAGLRVEVVTGSGSSMAPAPGTPVTTGTLVRLGDGT